MCVCVCGATDVDVREEKSLRNALDARSAARQAWWWAMHAFLFSTGNRNRCESVLYTFLHYVLLVEAKSLVWYFFFFFRLSMSTLSLQLLPVKITVICAIRCPFPQASGCLFQFQTVGKTCSLSVSLYESPSPFFGGEEKNKNVWNTLLSALPKLDNSHGIKRDKTLTDALKTQHTAAALRDPRLRAPSVSAWNNESRQSLAGKFIAGDRQTGERSETAREAYWQWWRCQMGEGRAAQ